MLEILIFTKIEISTYLTCFLMSTLLSEAEKSVNYIALIVRYRYLNEFVA